jgi:hypothetical protein
VKEKIWAAVKDGKLSEEDAEARWGAYLESLRVRGEDDRERRSDPVREEMAAVGEKIWAAVKDGEILEADAETRWAAYLEHLRGAPPTPGTR